MWYDFTKAPGVGKTIPLYYFYEMAHASVGPARMLAKSTNAYLTSPLNPLKETTVHRSISGATELFERVTRRYGKPEFGINEIEIDGKKVGVSEEIVWFKPFCGLLHFKRHFKAPESKKQKMLLIAPMSGHYATLLRNTVETMLPHYDLYITDWTDARDVPMSAGKFDLNDYVDYLIEIFHELGKGCHVMAVCQPCVPALAAISHMEANGDTELPATMTLMGGPIDTRESPTAVNELAENKGMDWFKENAIVSVPFPHAGMFRRVYPGFLQLTGFMSMNLDRHIDAHRKLFDNLIIGDGDSAEKHRDFYDEYLAVMDLTAEFYLQTIEEVFIKHALPKGEFMHKGEKIDLGSIKNTALLTLEGEKDDITGKGQTAAAIKLCHNLDESKKMHYEQEGVGHYGVFSGSRFRKHIAPIIHEFIKTHSQ